MSKELILKMCKEIVNGKDFDEEGFGCDGFRCNECPFERREEDGNIGCHDRTLEETIKIAQKYIAKNTKEEEKEMKNKFKVGDRVKKNNGKPFSNRDFIVTVEKVDGCKIWFKETSSFLTSEWLELAEERKIELTFKEFVNEAEEGKIYVSRMGVEFYKEDKKIKIKIPDGVKTNKISIPDDAILTLKKQEYTFTEAIEKAREAIEGNIITSLVSKEPYSSEEIKSGKAIFELNEIEGKWNVEE